MEYKLVIDIGNTRTKIAVFEGDLIRELHPAKKNISAIITRIIKKLGIPAGCIVSHVQLERSEILTALHPVPESSVVFIRPGLKLPIKVLYKTPETLGNDRLANACGAWKLNPGKNSLVIDMGTCIKYDFVNQDGEYPGGSISPGLAMRYKALSRFTGQLPYFKPVEEFPQLTGQSTEGAMRSGVENGILEEVNGILCRYQELADQTHIILTGGDHSKFADQLKSPIFVAPNLTLTGLKVILDHNDPS
jgi:type III pantothenate kinase